MAWMPVQYRTVHLMGGVEGVSRDGHRGRSELAEDKPHLEEGRKEPLCCVLEPWVPPCPHSPQDPLSVRGCPASPSAPQQ